MSEDSNSLDKLQTLFVALINREDRPLVIHAVGDKSAKHEIKYNVLSNIALDYFGDTTKSTTSSAPKYLFEIDGNVIYGEYLHQKGLKIVIGTNIRDDEAVLPFFQKVKVFYLKSVINPFNDDFTEQIRRNIDSLGLEPN